MDWFCITLYLALLRIGLEFQNLATGKNRMQAKLCRKVMIAQNRNVLYHAN
jgi:hypothetical protein